MSNSRVASEIHAAGSFRVKRRAEPDGDFLEAATIEMVVRRPERRGAGD